MKTSPSRQLRDHGVVEVYFGLNTLAHSRLSLSHTHTHTHHPLGVFRRDAPAAPTLVHAGKLPRRLPLLRSTEEGDVLAMLLLIDVVKPTHPTCARDANTPNLL